MTTCMRSMVALLTMALWLLGAAWCWALDVHQVQVSDQDFRVTIKASKTHYKVGEPVKFRVKGNKPFYLYLFSIDEKDNKAYLLLPNRHQAQNRFRAGREYTVPGKRVRFVGSRPGKEKIFMLASSAKLDLKLDGFGKAGDFMVGDNATLQAEVKALSVQAVERRQEKVMAELEVVIAPNQPAQASQGDKAVAFVSSDKVNYRLGEAMTITFGADRKGFVFLLFAREDGQPQLLKRQEVSGRDFYKVQGQAQAPGGPHTLLAVYSPQAELDLSRVRLPGPHSEQKDVAIVDDRPLPMAIYHLEIGE